MDPDAVMLMPQSPTDWLPEDHLAYFVIDLLEELDLGDIERAIQAKDARGERPCSPRMMTTLLLYGYAVGVLVKEDRARDPRGRSRFGVLAA